MKEQSGKRQSRCDCQQGWNATCGLQEVNITATWIFCTNQSCAIDGGAAWLSANDSNTTNCQQAYGAILASEFPHYAEAVAGFLYGPLWGGVWGTIGLLCGSMLAMTL